MKKLYGSFFATLLFLVFFEMLTPVYAANTCDEFMVVIMNRTNLDLTVIARAAQGVAQEQRDIPKGTSYAFKSGDSPGRTSDNMRTFVILRKEGGVQIWEGPVSKQYCGTDSLGRDYYLGKFNDINVKVTGSAGKFQISNDTSHGITNCPVRGSLSPQCIPVARGIIQLDVKQS